MFITMRFLPFLLLLALFSCERDAFQPVAPQQSPVETIAPPAKVSSFTIDPSIASSTWWQELSPAVRQFAGPELANQGTPVTLTQLNARFRQAAITADKKRSAGCGGFPTPNPAGDVVLNSQADVNAFGALKCKDILGVLNIIDTLGPDPIVDLTPLNKLKSVGSSLTIDAGSLTSLAGLEKLKTIGLIGPFGFIGVSGGSLTDIEALEGLRTISGSINVISCNQLTGFSSAFSQLVDIGADSIPGLTSSYVLNISNNAILTEVSGFSGLARMGSLLVQTNGGLTDLDDLSSLTTINRDIQIFGNTALENVDQLANISAVGRNLIVYDNPVLTSCCGMYGLLCADPPACTSSNVPSFTFIVDNGAGCTEADILAGGPCL